MQTEGFHQSEVYGYESDLELTVKNWIACKAIRTIATYLSQKRAAPYVGADAEINKYKKWHSDIASRSKYKRRKS